MRNRDEKESLESDNFGVALADGSSEDATSKIMS